MFCSKGDRLWSVVEAIVVDEGFSLYDLERQGNKALRVFIWQGKGGDGAVKAITSEDCSRVVRRLMVYFEVEGPELGLGVEPVLEVSSPGINRILRLPEHLDTATGERVKIICAPGIVDGSAHGQTLIGTLLQVDNDSVRIADEQRRTEAVIPRGEIKRAQVEFKF